MRRAASAARAGVSFSRLATNASAVSRTLVADASALTSRAQTASSGGTARSRNISNSSASSESFGLPKSPCGGTSSASSRIPVISGTVIRHVIFVFGCYCIALIVMNNVYLDRPLVVAGVRQVGPLLLELLDAADEGWYPSLSLPPRGSSVALLLSLSLFKHATPMVTNTRSSSLLPSRADEEGRS